MISVTAGWPRVIVPVLSSTTVSPSRSFERFTGTQENTQLSAFARADHHRGRAWPTPWHTGRR